MNKNGLNLKIKKEGLTSENIKLFADLYNLNFFCHQMIYLLFQNNILMTEIQKF